MSEMYSASVIEIISQVVGLLYLELNASTFRIQNETKWLFHRFEELLISITNDLYITSFTMIYLWNSVYIAIDITKLFFSRFVFSFTFYLEISTLSWKKGYLTYMSSILLYSSKINIDRCVIWHLLHSVEVSKLILYKQHLFIYLNR